MSGSPAGSRLLACWLEAIRERGYAVSHSELIKGAIALAVPFFAGGGHVAGSIGVFGPDVRLDAARIEGMAAPLMAHGRALSALLGQGQA